MAESPNWSVPLFVALAIILGGSSQPTTNLGFIFQIAALFFLAAVALRWRREASLEVPFGLIAVTLCCLALALLHLLPLPASFWSQLPGRGQIAAAVAVAGLESPTLPVSLHPQGTIRWALSAVPVATLAALLFLARGLPTVRVAQTILALGAVSFAMGVMQIQGGAQSPFYIHESTNDDLAVGFFANANHLATLLLITLPLAMAMFVALQHSHKQPTRVALIGVAGLIGLTAFGIYMTGSVAGLLLVVPTALASVFLLPGLGRGLRMLIVVAAGAVTAAGITLWKTGYLPLAFVDFEAGPLSRIGIAQTSAEGVRAYWPIGSGLGSFPVVFPLFEDVSEVERRFANHAHNDYLEIVFEAGLVGVVLIVAFLLWWSASTYRAWRAGPAGDGESRVWKKAASIVTGVVLIHSLVDYPARTSAILVIFSFYCIVLGSGSRSHYGARPVGRV